MILLLGSLLTLSGLRLPGWEGWLLAALVIGAVRPLACLVALAGSQLDRPSEKTFVAWFGVRGVGSLFYVDRRGRNGRARRPASGDTLVWTVVALSPALDRGPRDQRGPVDAPHVLRWTRVSRGGWCWVVLVVMVVGAGVGRPARRQRRLSL